MSKLLYLDNAATTKTAPEVVEAMLPYFTEKFGNPSSVYSFAAANKEVINQQRDAIAEMIGAKSNEIYFTGGGSESDNWALKCTAEAYANKGNHIITTKIEHHAILHTAEYLEKRGFEVTYLDVDEDGKVKLDDLKAAIRPTTILISVMFANNEIGTIQPIKEIGEIAHEHGILFHTDAVQAFGQLPINVDECHIDMLSASGHKFNGPKGIGIMYIRTGVKIRSFIHGGAQERKRRAGTENVPGIVGIGTAAKRAAANMEERTAKEREVRDYLIDRVLNEIPYCRLNGHRTDRLPNNANFSFQFVEGESLLIKLDMKGICGSSGSACTSGSLDPSHVLLAIGLPHEIAHGSLRLTLNEEIEKEDIDYVVDNLKEINDNFGHEKGDEALKLCYQCIRRAFKNEKNCFRIGGDEFAYVYHSEEKEQIPGCINVLERTLKETSRDLSYQLSISTGYAYYIPNTDIDFKDIVRRSDTMLYRQKRRKKLQRQRGRKIHFPIWKNILQKILLMK